MTARAPRYRGRAWQEARASILGWPGRSAVAVIGLAVAVALLITVQSLVATVRTQVSDAFDSYTATTVNAVVDSAVAPDGTAIGADHIDRASALPGVLAASRYADLASSGITVATSRAPRSEVLGQTPVFAADDVFTAAIGAQITGADLAQVPAGMPAVLIGRILADQIGLEPGEIGTRVLLIDGRPATISGVIEQAPRLRAAERGVILRLDAPLLTPQQRAPRTVILATQAGATAPIADVLADAMDPYHPETFSVSRPWTGSTLQTDVDALFVNLGWGASGVAALVGAIVIAAHAAGSVSSRHGEIGLRRSLGARRRDIVGQFLCESILLGAFAGCAGVALGVLTVLIACIANGWVPVVAPLALAVAPCGAVLVAALAGAFPAVRASRVDPASALRR